VFRNGQLTIPPNVDHSRKVLSWRFSNTIDKYFCMDALNEAIKRYGVPLIFNTDQGCQFISDELIYQKTENIKHKIFFLYFQ